MLTLGQHLAALKAAKKQAAPAPKPRTNKAIQAEIRRRQAQWRWVVKNSEPAPF